ncbi:46 kDa FK506-binding nuclear protein [Acromyrmex echinatior]|uniref:peptidylprolyl isomerase n=1 Tax=Acromyrmex echinatior TaxID=103372 RepID=F4X4T0_ACREC|nr:46 kDa FK506-binding nuclear protein [Acromyrmex echinatior]
MSHPTNVVIHITALTLQPGNKYSQYVNESFCITMASLDITHASDKPIQVMMTYEQTRFLLCTLHKDKPWQVQLDVLVQKKTVVTLSCDGESYVYLIGHYKIDLIKIPFNPNWITTLSWHILDEKINELKNKGTSPEELTEYLNKYTTVKIVEKWIVTPYSIKKKQIQKDRELVQVPNLKKKSFVKDNNRTKKAKCVKSLFHCNENINFNNVSSENSSEISSEESSESFSKDSFMESNDDVEKNDKENKSIYHFRSKNRQKNERKNENKMMQKRKKESKKQEIKEKQQKAKVIEKKSKENPNKTKKNSKQQAERIIKDGVKMRELRPGTGKIAEVGKYVTIFYVAYMKTGQILEEFDRFENLGFRFKLGAGFVIKGLDVGIIGMKIDEKRRLIMPPNMAYGDEGYGLKVPPNLTVIYDVELKKVE